MNNIITLKLELGTMVPNLARGRHVLIAVKNNSGEIMTGGKPKWYPEGLTRFVGGGIDEGEDVLVAAARELNEELQINVDKNDLKFIAEFDIQAYVKSMEKNFQMTTYVFGLTLKGDEVLVASDDVEKIHFLNKSEQNDLLKLYTNIDKLTENNDGTFMNWNDYGKVYGPIHKYVFENF